MQAEKITLWPEAGAEVLVRKSNDSIDGFVQFNFDYSFFTYVKGEKSLRVLIYVDDLILTGNDSTMMGKFKIYLNDSFKLKDLGRAKYFLGIEIARGPEGMFLSQRKYILDIIA